MKTITRFLNSLSIPGCFHRCALPIGGGALAAVLAALVGCQSAPPDFSAVNGAGQPGAGTVPPAIDSFRLHEGDMVKVVFEADTNLNTVAKIQANGAIALPLAGEMQAAGRTVVELQADVKDRYKSFLRVTDATVTLVQTAAGVYISGAVLRPGRVSMERPLTVLEAIMEAGGFNPNRAKSSAVTVLRMEGGQQKHYRLDLKKALKGNDPTPFYLQPQDIVHVPEKTFNF